MHLIATEKSCLSNSSSTNSQDIHVRKASGNSLPKKGNATYRHIGLNRLHADCLFGTQPRVRSSKYKNSRLGSGARGLVFF